MTGSMTRKRDDGGRWDIVEQAQCLASMQDFTQIGARDAELFGSLVDRQSLANDEADGGPVEDRFHASLSVHATHLRRVTVSMVLRPGPQWAVTEIRSGLRLLSSVYEQR